MYLYLWDVNEVSEGKAVVRPRRPVDIAIFFSGALRAPDTILLVKIFRWRSLRSRQRSLMMYTSAQRSMFDWMRRLSSLSLCGRCNSAEIKYEYATPLILDLGDRNSIYAMHYSPTATQSTISGRTDDLSFCSLWSNYFGGRGWTSFGPSSKSKNIKYIIKLHLVFQNLKKFHVAHFRRRGGWVKGRKVYLPGQIET